ncbi:MAG: nuclear transport factor 2 family protein [Solirubrobacteraceae bacterium]|nr:nuclear transport factor 2 family protein [Solirubrobacteraceae bacterium]
MDAARVRELVERVYAALGTGDRTALEAVLDAGFVGELADGLPDGLGGRREGPDAMIDRGWWAIGARYAVLAEPEEWIPCTDGRVLVRGTYRGRRRDDGRTVEAAFAHLWGGADGRLTTLWQVTDTARW